MADGGRILGCITVCAVMDVIHEEVEHQFMGQAGIIGAAITIGLLGASLSGALCPLLLERFGIDSALTAGVLPTMSTDLVGFVALLGLATLFLR